jgi:VWFA-related protein
MKNGSVMRRVLIAALVLAVALPSWAAKHMTVAQLAQMLSAESAVHKPDAEIAQKINGVELSERLSEKTLGQLSQPFPAGSKAAVALLLLADRSAFLDPPASEEPTTPAPDAAAQQKMLEAAQRFVLETLPRLPNLLATRTTLSFDDSPQEVTKGGYAQRVGLHLIGSSKAEVSVNNEKGYPLTTVAGQAPAQPQGGLTTWGEFGSALLIILSDSAHGKVTWSHWEETSSGALAVFHYDVPESASHYEIDTPVEALQSNGGSNRWARIGGSGAMTAASTTKMRRAKPAYRGSLWIDPATGTIVRLTLVADLRGNPTFESGAILVDYGSVPIAGRTLICPVRSLALSAAPPSVHATLAGEATEWLNENLFTSYHLFAATTRILTENSGESEPSMKPATVPTAAPVTASAPSEAAAGESAQTQAAPAAQQAAVVPAEAPSAAATKTDAPAASAAPATAGVAGEAKPAVEAAPSNPSVVETAAANQPPPPTVPPPPAPDKDVVLHVNVNELLVPVVVRDKRGAAVGNLTAKDFTVLDQGKPRTVTGFTLVRSTVPVQAVHGDAQHAAADTPVAQAAAQNRFIVFLFDDLHMEPADLVRTQKAAIAAMDTSLGATDYAAVISFAGVNSGFTRDRIALQTAVMKLTVHNSLRHDTHDCPDIDYYSADKILNQHDETEFQIAVAKVMACTNMRAIVPGTSNGSSGLDNPDNAAQRMALSAASHALAMGEQDARASLAAVSAVVHAMAKLPGQRSLILVSPGFLSLSPEMMFFKSSLLDEASASDVIVNALDARGLYAGNVDASQGSNTTISQIVGGTSQDSFNAMQQSENALAELANGTGGKFFHNNNDLEGGLKSLMAPPEYVYMLQVALNDVKPSGTYHRLQVKVDQADLQVQARRGYFAAKR